VVGKYSHEQYTVWAEFILFIERWLKISVECTTGYTPVELMLGETSPGISKKSSLNPRSSAIIGKTKDKLFRAYGMIKW
jgi:hypothetical protein